ncbi:MAG TPA: alpha/beta fold hydrolase [Cryomorphaceae bacterium]|nr:alpha/beta fold hydrolase [Cryomorphaceae bacterium]
MKEEYKKWYSPTLGKEMEMLVYGHYGTPLIIFPTTLGRFYESRDFKLIESAQHLVDEGRVKIYCPDTINDLSWYNKDIHPADRVKNHIVFEQFVKDEVVDAIRHEYGINKVAVGGASFGGYTAANFAFKNPHLVSHLISMSGSFDIRSFLNGHYDDNVYFNNPVDYLRNSDNPELWNLNITLGYGEWDICKDANLVLSDILSSKNISHWLDERRWAEHDWPLWRMMFPDYISKL